MTRARRKFMRLYLVALGALLLPGAIFFVPGAAPADADAATLAAIFQPRLEEGRTLYEERCATCHGTEADGTLQGPSLAGLGPADYDFMMSTGRMPLGQPTEQPVRRKPVLSRAQIDAVTAYLTSLSDGGGTPIPNVRPDQGTLSIGEREYQENCAPCHGTTGNGGAVGPRVAPDLHVSTPTQIAEAVRIGPTTMPQFDPSTISDAELDSLVRYVLYLRHPDERGGAGLTEAGPLIEGFVALLVGLGLIMLITRFIGERT